MGDYCERCRKSLPRLSITSTCDQCKEKINRERIEMEEAEKVRANRQTQKNLERYKKLREKESKKSAMIGMFDKFRKYDDDGYDKDGIHKDTGTKFNPFGFDKEGYDRYGHDSDGHHKEDHIQETYDKEVKNSARWVDTYDKEVKNSARWVDSPSGNSTKEPRIQKYDSEKTTNYELKEKESDIYKKFQEEQQRQKEIRDAEIRERERERKEREEKEKEYRKSDSYKKKQEEQRRQKAIRDAEIRERENYVYKKFQEEQLKNPRKDYSQNYKTDSVEDILKNLANEIFKENPQHSRVHSYTSKQESNREYRSPPKPTQQETSEHADVPDFSSNDPYRILGVFPDTPYSEKKQRYKELVKKYHALRGSANRPKEEQDELVRIQTKIIGAWDKIKSKT